MFGCIIRHLRILLINKLISYELGHLIPWAYIVSTHVHVICHCFAPSKFE